MLFKKLLRKVIVLVLILALGYGCWFFYDAKQTKQRKVDTAFTDVYGALIDEMNKTEGRDPTVLLERNAQMQALYPLSSYFHVLDDPTALTQLMGKLDGAVTAMTGESGDRFLLKGYEKLQVLKDKGKIGEKSAQAALDAFGLDIRTE